MTQTEQLRIVMVGGPFLAGIALFAFAMAQRNHFAADTEARQKVESQIAAAQIQMAAQASQPPSREAAVKDEPTEESVYLSFLRSAALSTGVKIIRWASNPRTPDVPGAPPAPPAIADIANLSGTLEVAGPYPNVLSFTRQLESSHRLLNLSNVNWNRPENGFDIHLTATVTRYILKPAPPAAPPQ